MPVIRGTKPTRAVLIALKRRMKVAKTGHSLLKMKRDGLMIEFFEVLNKAKTVRKELVEALIKAEQVLKGLGIGADLILTRSQDRPDHPVVPIILSFLFLSPH